MFVDLRRLPKGSATFVDFIDFVDIADSVAFVELCLISETTVGVSRMPVDLKEVHRVACRHKPEEIKFVIEQYRRELLGRFVAQPIIVCFFHLLHRMVH